MFLFAFLVRLVGITWGLPNALHNQSYHPDEQVIFSYSQGVDIAHAKFTPGNYSYGTLYLTLLSLASKVISGYGGGPGNSLESIWAFIGTVDLAGRILSALAGASTCLVLFLMLRRWTNMLGSLAGGLLLALAPAFVVHSRFQTVDVLATFLLTLSLYYCTLLIRSPKDPETWEKQFVKFAVLAGVFAGLSAGTKYTGILAVLSLIAACAFSQNKDRLKAGLLGLGAAVLAFLVSTPGVLLDSQRFQHDFRYEMLHTSTGHDLLFVDVGSGFAYHIVNLIAGITPLLLLMSAAGVVISLVRRQKWMFVLAVFSLLYFILIGRAEVLFIRYTFPLYVILAAGFGWWMGESHAKAGKHRTVVAFGIISLGLAAMITVNFTSWMAGSDPRDITAREMAEISKSKPGTTVGIVSNPWFYTPPFIPDSASMRGMFPAPPRPVEVAQMQEAATSKNPHLEQFVPGNINERFDWDSRLITQLKPDYIVYSSFEQYDVDRLQNAKNLAPTDQLKVDRYRDFQQKLAAGYTPASWEQADYPTIHDLAYVHPYIFIWKRKDLN